MKRSKVWLLLAVFYVLVCTKMAYAEHLYLIIDAPCKYVMSVHEPSSDPANWLAGEEAYSDLCAEPKELPEGAVFRMCDVDTSSFVWLGWVSPTPRKVYVRISETDLEDLTVEAQSKAGFITIDSETIGYSSNLIEDPNCWTMIDNELIAVQE